VYAQTRSSSTFSPSPSVLSHESRITNVKLIYDILRQAGRQASLRPSFLLENASSSRSSLSIQTGDNRRRHSGRLYSRIAQTARCLDLRAYIDSASISARYLSLRTLDADATPGDAKQTSIPRTNGQSLGQETDGRKNHNGKRRMPRHSFSIVRGLVKNAR